MQINRIKTNHVRPSFGELIVTPEAQKVMNKTFSEVELEKLEEYRKQLENTKNFDLEISSVCNDLYYGIAHKTNPRRYSSEGPLYAKKVEGNRLTARGTDWLDCGDTIPYYLKFASATEATDAYAKLAKYENKNKPFQRNNFDKLSWAVESVKLLDENNDDEQHRKNVRVIY